MIEEIAVIGVIGTVIATVVDQQNLIPQISNNPRKLWFWDPVRYQPAPAARLPTRPVLLTEQQLMRNAEQERLWEMEKSRRQSKYIVTDTSVPATKFEPYRK
jgi:hypothetical protein